MANQHTPQHLLLANKKWKCKLCSRVFSRRATKTRPPVFCNQDCRNSWFALFPKYKQCIVCQKEIKDRLSGNKKYCSQKCYWGTLKRLSQKEQKQTYVWIVKNGRRQYEHRLVMQKHLGRRLKKSEVVHHKDGNKRNNNLSNLELISQSQHIKEHFMTIQKQLKLMKPKTSKERKNGESNQAAKKWGKQELEVTIL